MILVPLDEADACKKSTRYYANEIMRQDDSVDFVFVTTSTGISAKVTDNKGATTSGAPKGAKQVKEDLRDTIHSLYPDLKQVVIAGNGICQLPGSKVSQE
jgi:hypothetical protein